MRDYYKSRSDLPSPQISARIEGAISSSLLATPQREHFGTHSRKENNERIRSEISLTNCYRVGFLYPPVKYLIHLEM